MKIKMPNGVILESENSFVNEQRIKYGGVEVTSETETKKPKATKKSED